MRLFWTGVIFSSALLAVLVFVFNQNPINPDGMLYLQTANVYQADGFKAALELYPWPFYPVLIAKIHQWVGLSLFNTAFWLDNLFVTGIIIFFLLNLQKLGASQTVLYWGALVIVCFPTLNHFRHDIIRDTGYWAFLLAGITVLFSYQQKPSVSRAYIFQIAMLAAFLFRIEAVVVWVLAPFLLKKPRAIIHCTSIVMIAIIMIAFWKFVNPSLHHIATLGRLSDLINYSKHIFMYSNFKDMINILTVFFGVITPVYLIILIITIIRLGKNPIFKNPLWQGLVLINFLIPVLFYFHSNIITERYFVACGLILLLSLPVTLADIKINRSVMIGVILLASILLINSIVPFGYSKAYIRQSGLWLNSNIPKQAVVYSNSMEVLFYADRLPKNWQNFAARDKIGVLLNKNEREKYNYLAIRINQGNKNLQQKVDGLHLRPIKVFDNKRQDKVVIFYVTH